MCTELMRSEFIGQLTSIDYQTGSWIAIHIFVVPEWLDELDISASNRSAVTETMANNVRKVLVTLGEGVFLGAGWLTFIAVVRGERDALAMQLTDALGGLVLTDDYYRLWRFALSEIGGQSPSEVLDDLAWKSTKKARVLGKDTGFFVGV